MKKSLSNKLKYVILLESLLVILFTVIIFSVPFGNKFNGSFFVSFVSVLIAMIMIFSIIAIIFTQEKYHNEKCVGRVLLFSCLYSVLSVAASIILVAVNGNSPLEVYIPLIIVAIVNLAMIFLLIYSLISNEEDKEAQ